MQPRLYNLTTWSKWLLINESSLLELNLVWHLYLHVRKVLYWCTLECYHTLVVYTLLFLCQWKCVGSKVKIILRNSKPQKQEFTYYLPPWSYPEKFRPFRTQMTLRTLTLTESLLEYPFGLGLRHELPWPLHGLANNYSCMFANPFWVY